MLPRHLPLDAPNRLALMLHLEFGAIRLDQFGRPFTLVTKALPRRPAALSQSFLNGRYTSRRYDQPAGGHHPHQVMELTLDVGKTCENIGVVEFQVVDNQGARPVMHELGALIKKSTVVLVRLNHEKRCLPQPGRQWNA